MPRRGRNRKNFENAKMSFYQWVLSHERYPEVYSVTDRSDLMRRRFRELQAYMLSHFKKQLDLDHSTWRDIERLTKYYTAGMLLWILIREFKPEFKVEVTIADPYTDKRLADAKKYSLGRPSRIRQKKPGDAKKKVVGKKVPVKKFKKKAPARRRPDNVVEDMTWG